MIMFVGTVVFLFVFFCSTALFSDGTLDSFGDYALASVIGALLAALCGAVVMAVGLLGLLVFSPELDFKESERYDVVSIAADKRTYHVYAQSESSDEIVQMEILNSDTVLKTDTNAETTQLIVESAWNDATFRNQERYTIVMPSTIEFTDVLKDAEEDDK